ncbi:MAG: SH3 domain-containing protein [bacterium]|nr:SH3 domain-containing protein [bacterium]
MLKITTMMRGMNMIKKLAFVVLMGCLLSAGSTLAQTTCPADVILAFARAGSACLNTGRDQVCYGNGAVTAQGFGGAALFNLPGDRTSTEGVQQLVLGGGAEYSIAQAAFQGSLPTNDQRAITLLAFGDVALTHQVQPRTEIRVTATGTVNIRELPTATAPVLAQIGVRESLIAFARSQDSAWVQVILPGQGTRDDLIGWASLESLTVTGDLNTLALSLNLPGDPLPNANPFQKLTLRTGRDDAPCTGTPESGVLLQAPGSGIALLILNDSLRLSLSGTAFIQADDGTMVINVLDGEALIGLGEFSAQPDYPAGTRGVMTNGTLAPAEPYDPADLAGLPINNLPVRFRVPTPLTAEQIAQAHAAYLARFVTPTPPPPDPTVQAQCRRTVRQNADLRAGPGLNYEIANSIAAGTRIFPALASPDSEGGLWYQLPNSNWISAGLVEETGMCDPVPVTSRADAPSTNFVSLETCESTNGPIRAGQTVTVEFVPPAYETLSEAQNATRWDAGEIRVENRSLRVRASQPIRIANDRWVRTFSAVWTAATGTFRISGQRLDYQVICDISVAVG